MEIDIVHFHCTYEYPHSGIASGASTTSQRRTKIDEGQRGKVPQVEIFPVRDFR